MERGFEIYKVACYLYCIADENGKKDLLCFVVVTSGALTTTRGGVIKDGAVLVVVCIALRSTKTERKT